MSKKLIPVVDNPDIGRDPVSGAIISTNKVAYVNHMKSKQSKILDRERIESLENDISELKQMIAKLLERQ